MSETKIIFCVFAGLFLVMAITMSVIFKAAEYMVYRKMESAWLMIPFVVFVLLAFMSFGIQMRMTQLEEIASRTEHEQRMKEIIGK